jgi:hypothetical protein
LRYASASLSAFGAYPVYVSLNEIDAAFRRAARGVGFHWGLADEVGRAARWLAARRIAAPDIVLSALEAHEGRPISAMNPIESKGVWQASGGILSPILAGARFSDEAGVIGNAGLVLTFVLYPVVLLPWVAWTAHATGQAFEVLWPDARIRALPGGVDLAGRDAANCREAANVNIGIIDAALPGDACHEHRFGVEVEPSTWSRLLQVAHRSFVPASERSRLTGAGAGLSDNE